MFELSANTEMTMSSREIAQLTRKDHKNVLRVIRSLIDGQVLVAQIEPLKFEYRGQWFDYYELNKRDSLVVVARLSPEFTAAVVDRWQELESNQPTLPTSFAEALQLAANQAKELEDKKQALALAAPKAEFVDRYVESSGLMTFRQVAKQLEIKEPAFRSFLVAINAMYYMNGSWSAYQKHIDAGRFKLRQGEKNGHAYVTTKFTAKGMEWVARKWNEFRQAAACVD